MHHFCDKLLRKMQGVGVSGHFVSHVVGGRCLARMLRNEEGYQLERDKLLRGGGSKLQFFHYVLFE